MWCEILNIGGITPRVCERWMIDETTTCGVCKGTARVPYPVPIPACGCGHPGNHPALCTHRRSFFEKEREPTDREKAYVQNLLGGTSKTAAAALVGATPNQMDTYASRRYMSFALEQAGITDDFLAQSIQFIITPPVKISYPATFTYPIVSQDNLTIRRRIVIMCM